MATSSSTKMGSNIRWRNLEAFTASGSKQKAIEIRLVDKPALLALKKTASAMQKNWLELHNFTAKGSSWVMLPADGKPSKPSAKPSAKSATKSVAGAVMVLASSDDASIFGLLARQLPSATYRYDEKQSAGKISAEEARLAWGLGAYSYKTTSLRAGAKKRAVLQDAPSAQALAINWGRDMVNAPGNLLYPKDLADCAIKAGKELGASIKIAKGAELKKLCPMTHVVGAAGSPPLLIDMRWRARKTGKLPSLTIIGKGVTFDTGGLNLKPAQFMRLMKKDMGGAAHALVLLRMIIESKLPCEVRLLVPSAENSISTVAYRPGDVLQARDGTTTEVGDTDAEGRLLLADALILAAQDKPDFIIDFATLTGAARVALGSGIPNLFVRNEGISGAWTKRFTSSADQCRDPLWPIPLWQPYKKELASPVATRSSIGKTGYGGAITAALFLEDFLPKEQAWAHIDVMSWALTSSPTSPVGGDIQGVRASFDAIKTWLQKSVKK